MALGKAGKYIDKYEVLEEVGCGGMGSVYKALHPHFKKYVAIKEIRSDLASNPEIQQRFEREAELLAQLPPHPNIVTIRDALVWRGQLYLVMDYIEGGTLGDLVMQDGVAPERGADLLDQILSGLEAIHTRGIVHRDLKPGNILIDREGIAYISDFGIAGSIGMPSRAETMATAKYVAPEVIDPELGRGAAEQEVDVYATGMLAYEMLLGENRFREEFHEVYYWPPKAELERWLLWHTDLARAARNLNDIDPKIPRPLANVIKLIMAEEVKERYRTASDARRDLATWMQSGQDARGRRTGPPSDDATLPLDQLRRAGSSSTRPAPPRRVRRPVPPAPREPLTPGEPSPEQPRINQSSIPRWAWWAGGVAALTLVIAFVLISLLVDYPGFTLVVRGAPPGSDVYVDGVRRGVPSLNKGTLNGEIRVYGLEAGRSREVRVSCDGYEDFKQSVIGQDGEEKVLSVPPMSGGRPSEIDYNGPMILIPAGKFIMGDNNHESDEKPEHELPLPDYYIDKFEVTNGQYKEFLDKNPGRTPPKNPWWAPNYFENNPHLPVINVTWDDAAAYARSVHRRLPTEQEWEKAASWEPAAQKKRQWPWAEIFERGHANIESTYPTRGGQYSNGASAYGVQDMAGNVAEWVEDYYRPYPGNQTPAPDYGTNHRVVRGGNFRDTNNGVRTTRRFHEPPDISEAIRVEAGRRVEVSPIIGFRCAVSADDPRLQEFLRKRGPSR